MMVPCTTTRSDSGHDLQRRGRVDQQDRRLGNEKLTLSPGPNTAAFVLFSCASASLTEEANELAWDPKRNRTAAMATMAIPAMVIAIESLMAPPSHGY
jgi:hypothetical protein